MGKQLFSSEEQEKILESIRNAEKATSGEIRVHVEPTVSGDPVKRAEVVFHELGMTQTELKNGVLIYLAYESKMFAIIGDSGIHEKVGDDFWQEEKKRMHYHFSAGNIAAGICEAVELAGEKLKVHFPYNKSDMDELSNEISFGGNNHE